MFDSFCLRKPSLLATIIEAGEELLLHSLSSKYRSVQQYSAEQKRRERAGWPAGRVGHGSKLAAVEAALH